MASIWVVFPLNFPNPTLRGIAQSAGARKGDAITINVTNQIAPKRERPLPLITLYCARRLSMLASQPWHRHCTMQSRLVEIGQ